MRSSLMGKLDECRGPREDWSTEVAEMPTVDEAEIERDRLASDWHVPLGFRGREPRDRSLHAASFRSRSQF